MGVSSFSSFDGPDFLAFTVCGAIGYFIGSLAPAGAPSIYTSILVSYHLFLVWLILRTRGDSDQGDKKAGISLPVVHTVLTHASCLIVILGPVAIALHAMPAVANPRAAPVDTADPEAAALAMGQTDHTLRLIKGVCCTMAALAVFERRWLFSSEPSATVKPQPASSPAVPAVHGTANDAVEWQRYLATHRQSFAPGASVKAEYEKWLATRHGNKPPPGRAAG